MSAPQDRYWLRLRMLEFERRYGMTSDEHYKLRQAGELPDTMSRFDSHVWASFTEEYRNHPEETQP